MPEPTFRNGKTRAKLQILRKLGHEDVGVLDSSHALKLTSHVALQIEYLTPTKSRVGLVLYGTVIFDENIIFFDLF